MILNNSPLRYPGGKQKLSPFILELMETNGLCGSHYVEPYAGGAGVAIELLIKDKVEHIHLNDSCVGVYLFWRSLLTKTEEFCHRISRVSLTVDEWRRQKNILAQPNKFNWFDVGFSMFYLNRCNRSGILSGGVIGGLDQSGKWKIDARFQRNELIRRVETIAMRKKSITLKNWDAERFILEYVPKLPKNTLIYCDPPYFNKSQKLYLNHYKTEDHTRIAHVIQNKIKHRWVISYDSAPEILKLYSGRQSFTYELQYNASRVYKGKEVLFFSDKLRLPLRSTLPSINTALESMAA